ASPRMHGPCSRRRSFPRSDSSISVPWKWSLWQRSRTAKLGRCNVCGEGDDGGGDVAMLSQTKPDRKLSRGRRGASTNGHPHVVGQMSYREFLHWDSDNEH